MASKHDRPPLALERLSLNNENDSGLYASLRVALFCSRVMGLLPLSGLTCQKSDNLRFTLRSPYTIYFAVSLFGQVFMALTTFSYFVQNGISLANITNTIFSASSLITLLVLVNMGRTWPLFTKTIEKIEKKLPPCKRNIVAMTTMTTVFVLVSAVVEHILSVVYGFTIAYSCDPNNVAENYFKASMPWIFDYTSFAMWKAVISEIFNIQSTFIWSYNDLVMMLISICLAEHFLVHNELLKEAVKQEHFLCAEFRTQYLKIVHLVKLVNDHFGIYLLTSISGNLYWICTQLFYALNKGQTGHFIACELQDSVESKSLHGVNHSLYFTYSFSFLVIRALLVLLLAARIHSNALVPVEILYDLPSSKYNVEVQRYVTQVKSLKIAMSGLEFFYVTRTMILTMFGTIVTYELVLFQFNK